MSNLNAKLNENLNTITIFGSGPAGLMCATQLVLALNQAQSRTRFQIQIAERRKGLGRKLLIAGSSGLNISHQLEPKDFAAHYEGWKPELWSQWLHRFGPKAWIEWIHSLGLETFVGTSNRYFVRDTMGEMKASSLLKKWTQWLEVQQVQFLPAVDFVSEEGQNWVQNSAGVVLALGGGSWETDPVVWPALLEKNWQVPTHPFTSANVGYEVAWKPEFLQEAEGKPLKNIVLRSPLGEKPGELMITHYGLEGTPIYFLGTPGRVEIDLKPAWSEQEVLNRLTDVRENWSPLRRAQKKLGLSSEAQALLFHHSKDVTDLKKMASLVKRFPIELLRARPLSEAISSRGGVDLECVRIDPGNEFVLKGPSELFQKPVLAVGEMLNWSAPTGGFLIQAAITQGAIAGQNLARLLLSR